MKKCENIAYKWSIETWGKKKSVLIEEYGSEKERAERD